MHNRFVVQLEYIVVNQLDTIHELRDMHERIKECFPQEKRVMNLLGIRIRIEFNMSFQRGRACYRFQWLDYPKQSTER